MKIDASNNGDGTIRLSFGEFSVDLNGREVKTLLAMLTNILAPDTAAPPPAGDRTERFTERLTAADDVAVQIFIQAASHDDIVVLLKAAEGHAAVREKVFRNISEASRKICIEDMEFKFRDAVRPNLIVTALDRLSRTADRLQSDGRAEL